MHAGAVLFPKSAALHYSFGLYLVRQKHYQAASSHFQLAVTLAPGIEQYAYTYILSLDGEAQQLNSLGQYLYNKLNRR